MPFFLFFSFRGVGGGSDGKVSGIIGLLSVSVFENVEEDGAAE